MRAHAPNLTGLCLCGCGQLTTVMDQTNISRGLIKGESRSFIHGHHRRREDDLEGGPNPSGLCWCGCGEKALRAKRTDELNVKGQYRRFLIGHSRKGKIDLTAKDRSRNRYRARKLGQFIEDVDRQIVYQMHGGMCGICKDLVSKDDFHVDHIVPLSKGGMHGYINTQPTHPKCNLKKWSHL